MSYKTPNIDRTAYVSPTFADSDNTHKFSTIQAAIDYIHTTYGAITDSSNKAIVKVAPGKYTEQIHSYENIVITSQTSGYESIDTNPPATIYNTGADSATYPLRSDEDEVYDLVGVNIETAVSGTLGKVPNGDFYSCKFNDGHFIERDSNVLSIFSNCSFFGSSYGGFNLTGENLTGYRNLIFINCNIGFNKVPTLTSTHTSWANFKWTDVDLEGALDIGGDWDCGFSKSYIYRYAKRNNFNTTGDITILDSIISNGLHFESEPVSFVMLNSSFVDGSGSRIPDGEGDITADTTISGAIYLNNTQHNGLDGEIRLVNKQKSVGSNCLDGYRTLQEAINSIDIEGTIKLSDNIESLEKLTITGSKEIAVDGGKQWGLSFTGDVIDIGDNQKLELNELAEFTGGTVTISGSNAEFYVHGCSCGDNTIEILATAGAGSKVHILNSSISGDTGHSVLQINNTDTTYQICYSKLKGATGQPAVEFTVEADNTLQAKYSTFIHGDGIGSPINRVGGYTVTTSTYLCAGNASLSPAGIANDITGNGNTNDGSIDF